MKLHLEADRRAMSAAAAHHAAASIREIITRLGRARIVAATGASQLEFLREVTSQPGIDWTRVELFHLDEYAGVSETHPASFRRYLQENTSTARESTIITSQRRGKSDDARRVVMRSWSQ
jgi:glucosamine-6-phosphate deaminase